MRAGSYKHASVLLNDAVYLERTGRILHDAAKLATHELGLEAIAEAKKIIWDHTREQRLKR